MDGIGDDENSCEVLGETVVQVLQGCTKDGSLSNIVLAELVFLPVIMYILILDFMDFYGHFGEAHLILTLTVQNLTFFGFVRCAWQKFQVNLLPNGGESLVVNLPRVEYQSTSPSTNPSKSSYKYKYH